MQEGHQPVVVYGAGAHGSVLIEALTLAGRIIEPFLIDDDTALHGNTIDDRVVRPPHRLDDFDPDAIELVNAVGSVGLPIARRKVYERLFQRGFRFASVEHPSAIIAPSATISKGAQLMAGCVVQTRAIIGVNTIINTRASVDHDCRIGEHCHLAPGVTLSGGVTVGDGCHLGTAAVVIQGVTIGKGSFIAAGAVVTKDLPAGSSVQGVPARPRG